MKFGNHKNFHGSRDMYSVFKFIKSRIDINKTPSSDELIIILKESIERNFSGDLYQITDNNKKIETLGAHNIASVSSGGTSASQAIAQSTTAAPVKKVGGLRARLANKKEAANAEAAPVNVATDLPSNNSMNEIQSNGVDNQLKFEGNWLYNK